MMISVDVVARGALMGKIYRRSKGYWNKQPPIIIIGLVRETPPRGVVPSMRLIL